MKHMLIIILISVPLFAQEEIPQPIWTAKYNARDVAFSPDGNLLAIGNDDHKAYIVNSFTGEVLQELLHEDGWPGSVTNSWVTNVAFTPDGKTLLTVSSGRNIFFWETETWQKYDSISFDPDNFKDYYIEELDISNNAKYLALSMSGGGFGIIDLETKDFRNWDDADYFVASGQTFQYANDYVSISQDNKYIMASFSGWERVKIFDIETLEEVKEYQNAYRGDFNPVKDEHFIQKADFISFYESNWDEDVKRINPYSAAFHVNYSFDGGYLEFFRVITPKIYDYNDEREVIDIPYNNGLCKLHLPTGLVALNGVAVFNFSNYLSINPKNESSFQISPNPAENSFTIEFYFENPTEFNLSISDITGNIIETIDSGYGTENYSFNYNCQHIPLGSYFITLQLNETQLTKQIQIVR